MHFKGHKRFGAPAQKEEEKESNKKIFYSPIGALMWACIRAELYVYD